MLVEMSATPRPTQDADRPTSPPSIAVRDDDSTITGQPADQPDGESDQDVETDESYWQVATRGRVGFWASAALLALFLLALLTVTNTGSSVFPDEGVYAAQAQNLARGTWASNRPAADFDVDGSFDLLLPDAVIDDTSVPYAAHPLYPLILSIAYRLGGWTGMVTLSAIATWAAAVSAGLIARRLRAGLGIPAMWLVGAGSPLLFGAYLVVGQSIAAALAGFLMLVVLATGGRSRPIALLAPPIAVVLCLVRSEGIVVVCAIACTLGIRGLLPLVRRRRPEVASILLGAALLIVAVLTKLIEVKWAASIRGVGNGEIVGGVVRQDSEPFRAAWIGLLQPWHIGVDAFPAAALTALATLLGAIALRLMPRRPLLGTALVVMAAASAIAAFAQPPFLIAGFVPAFPICMLGLVFLKRRDLLQREITMLLSTVALSTIVIVSTTYGDGGATQWGGRFFHVLLPIITPLVALGLLQLLELVARPYGRVTITAAAIMTAAISALSLHTQIELRSTIQQIVEETDLALSHAESEGAKPLGIVALFSADGTSRAFWDSRDRLEIVRANHIAQLGPMIYRADTTGYNRVVVLSTRDAATLELFIGKALQKLRWQVVRSEAVGDTGYLVIEYGPIG